MRLVGIIPLLRIGFGVLALGAIGSQLAIHVQLGFSVVNYLSYFTNLSNAYAACLLILGGCHSIAPELIPSPSDPLRAAGMSYLVIVGIVFGLLLRNEELGALRPWVNAVLHIIMPCVVVLDWLIAPPRAKLSPRDIPQMLIPPAIYLACILVRGNRVGWYPYPFLNPSLPGGYSSVVVHIVAMAVTFVSVAFLAVVGGDRLRSIRDAKGSADLYSLH
jgi:hypothetical protein